MTLEKICLPNRKKYRLCARHGPNRTWNNCCRDASMCPPAAITGARLASPSRAPPFRGRGNVGVLVAGRRLGSAGHQAGRQRQAYACARQQQQPTAGARARTCGCTAREPGGAAAVAPRVRPTGTYPLLLPAPVGRPAGLPREASR